MAKKKFDTFGDFILKDEKIVMKVLLTTSMWAGNIILTLIVLALWFTSNREVSIILGILSLFGWWRVIKFYRFGGPKNIPDMKAETEIWGKNREQDKVINNGKEESKGKA